MMKNMRKRLSQRGGPAQTSDISKSLRASETCHQQHEDMNTNEDTNITPFICFTIKIKTESKSEESNKNITNASYQLLDAITSQKFDPSKVDTDLKKRGFILKARKLDIEESKKNSTGSYSLLLTLSDQLVVKLALQNGLKVGLFRQYRFKERSRLAEASLSILSRMSQRNEAWLAHTSHKQQAATTYPKSDKLWSSHQHLNQICDYYGPRISVYYGFLAFYTQSLVPLAICGIFLFCQQIMQKQIDTSLMPMFAFVSATWGTLFLEFWKRENAVLQFNWGIFSSAHQYAEQGVIGTEPGAATQLILKQRTKKKTEDGKVFRLAFSFVVMAAMLLTMLRLMFYYNDLQARATQIYGTSLLRYYPTIIYSSFPIIISLVCDPVAEYVNKFEGHDNDEVEENSLIVKKFSLQFINRYCALFYTAFVLRDVNQLRALLLNLLLVGAIINNFTEVGMPYLTSIYRRNFTTKSRTSSVSKSISDMLFAKASDRRVSSGNNKHEEEEESRPPSMTTEEYVAILEAECSYNEYDIGEDYLEMVLQSGYISIFAVVFPIAPCLALLNNIFEGSVDLLKMKGLRKPKWSHRGDIGSWYWCLVFISFVSVLSNFSLLYFYSSHISAYCPGILGLGDYINTDAGKIVFCLVVEHLLIAVKALFGALIDDVPPEVQERLIEMQAIAEQRAAADNVAAYLNKPLVPTASSPSQDSTTYSIMDSMTHAGSKFRDFVMAPPFSSVLALKAIGNNKLNDKDVEKDKETRKMLIEDGGGSGGGGGGWDRRDGDANSLFPSPSRQSEPHPSIPTTPSPGHSFVSSPPSISPTLHPTSPSTPSSETHSQPGVIKHIAIPATLHSHNKYTSTPSRKSGNWLSNSPFSPHAVNPTSPTSLPALQPHSLPHNKKKPTVGCAVDRYAHPMFAGLTKDECDRLALNIKLGAELEKRDQNIHLSRYNPFIWVGLFFIPWLLHRSGLPPWVYFPAAILYFSYMQRKKDKIDQHVGISIASDPDVLKHVLSSLPSWVHSSDFQRVEWLNGILIKLWDQLSKAIDPIIRAQVQPLLDGAVGKTGSDAGTSFTSLTLTSFSLGTISPRITGVKLHSTEETTVRLDLELRWASNVCINLDIGMSGLPLTVSLSDLKVTGTVRVELVDPIPMMPLYQVLMVSCMVPPHIDFSFKIANLDLMNVGISVVSVKSAVHSVLNSILSDLIVYPKKICIPLCDTADLAAHLETKPVALLSLSIEKAINLKRDRYSITAVEPFVEVRSTSFVQRTRRVHNACNPVFDTKMDIIVYSKQKQVVDCTVYGFVNHITVPTVLGKVQLHLNDTEDFVKVNEEIPLTDTTQGSLIMSYTYIPLRDARSSSTGQDLGGERDEDEVIFNVTEDLFTSDVINDTDAASQALSADNARLLTSPSTSTLTLTPTPTTMPLFYTQVNNRKNIGVLSVSLIRCRGLPVKSPSLYYPSQSQMYLSFDIIDADTEAPVLRSHALDATRGLVTHSSSESAKATNAITPKSPFNSNLTAPSLDLLGLYNDPTEGTYERVTKQHKDQPNPVYDETFNFILEDPTRFTLQVKLMDRASILENIKGVNSVCIGKVLVPLSSFISERSGGAVAGTMLGTGTGRDAGMGGGGRGRHKREESRKSGMLEREWPFSTLGSDAFVGFKVMWLQSE